MRIMLNSLLLLLPACAAIAAAPPPARRAAAPAATTAKLPDAVLEKAIRDRFQRSKIRVEGFTVHVEGGVATIEGKTKVIQRKGTATRLARLAGARTVRNRIAVDEAALEKAAANLEMGRRRAQVKRGEVRTQATTGRP
jgi:hypothetical protein